MQPRAQALIHATAQKQSALLAFLDVFWLLWQWRWHQSRSDYSPKTFDAAPAAGH